VERDGTVRVHGCALICGHLRCTDRSAAEYRGASFWPARPPAIETESRQSMGKVTVRHTLMNFSPPQHPWPLPSTSHFASPCILIRSAPASLVDALTSVCDLGEMQLCRYQNTTAQNVRWLGCSSFKFPVAELLSGPVQILQPLSTIKLTLVDLLRSRLFPLNSTCPRGLSNAATLESFHSLTCNSCLVARVGQIKGLTWPSAYKSIFLVVTLCFPWLVRPPFDSGIKC
jgi:hypothetical protein